MGLPSAWAGAGAPPPPSPNPRLRRRSEAPQGPHPSEPARELLGHFHQIVHPESRGLQEGVSWAPEGSQVWEDSLVAGVPGPLSQPNLGFLSFIWPSHNI